MGELLKNIRDLLPWIVGLAFWPKLIISVLVVGIAVLFLVLIWSPPATVTKSEDPGIKHVRTSITHNKNGLPVLDITLRNGSNSVAVITAATVKVVERWHIGPYWVRPSALPVSHSYDLPVSGDVGAIEKVQLSQELRPQTAERFQLVLGPKDSGWWFPPIGQFILLLEVSLVYNEDSKTVLLPLVFTEVPPAMEMRGMFNPGPPEGALKALLQSAKTARAAATNERIVDQATLETLDKQIAEIEEVLKQPVSRD